MVLLLSVNKSLNREIFFLNRENNWRNSSWHNFCVGCVLCSASTSSYYHRIHSYMGTSSLSPSHWPDELICYFNFLWIFKIFICLCSWYFISFSFATCILKLIITLQDIMLNKLYWYALLMPILCRIGLLWLWQWLRVVCWKPTQPSLIMLSYLLFSIVSSVFKT